MPYYPNFTSFRPTQTPLEPPQDNAFDEEFGDEVCFLVDNFHVKESDSSSFMPYIM
jgi:hypothetical protein